MLQIPAILANNSKPQSTDAPAAGDEATSFADVLDVVGSRLAPEQLRAELRKQVDEGMPLDEVLDNLVQRLEDDENIQVSPAMMPVLTAAVEEVTDTDQDLLTGLVSEDAAEADAELFEASAGTALKALRLDSDVIAEEPMPVEQLLPKDNVLEKALFSGRVGNTDQSVAIMQPALPKPADFNQLLSTALPATEVGRNAGMLDLPPRVGESGWGQAMAQRIMWMVGREQQTAQMRLNPAHLGPIEVKVSMQHDQASVSLMAHNGAVRDALEQALPRLRDMFSQQDIQLIQVDIGQRQEPRHGQAENNASGSQAGQGQAGASGSFLEGEDEMSSTVVTRQSRGLLDAYA